MEKEYLKLEGTVLFAHLVQPDEFRNTKNYKVTLALDDSTADMLESKGVKIKLYEKDDGTVVKQREFKTKFENGPPPVYDIDGKEIPASSIAWGDTVRIMSSIYPGNDKGRGTYVTKVKLLEKNPKAIGEPTSEANPGDF